MKILVEQKSYYRDCCDEYQDLRLFKKKVVDYYHPEKEWPENIFYCKHCGQLWREERYLGSCSGETDTRLHKMNIKIRLKNRG